MNNRLKFDYIRNLMLSVRYKLNEEDFFIDKELNDIINLYYMNEPYYPYLIAALTMPENQLVFFDKIYFKYINV